eukprot:jgi/Tetstr1/427448/TSEL_001748.t1
MEERRAGEQEEVAVVERATWEAQFRLAAWNELGRDWRLSNAAKSFKLCGFPSALLACWVNDIVVKKCREPSPEAWDREYPSVKYCERGDSEKHGVGRLVPGYVFLTMRAMKLLFEQAKVTRYPHIPPWACDQREYVQYKFHQSVPEEQEIYMDKLQLPNVEQVIQQAGTWGFHEPALRPGWGQQGHINYYPITAWRYKHPALTKAVAGFMTYGDHAAWLEKQAKARSKRGAQQERRALDEDYLAKRNERLRMLVVPCGRERLAANGNYSPNRDPMFNGQDKEICHGPV